LAFSVAFLVPPSVDAASYSKSDTNKIKKVCKDKLGKNTKALELGACETGYILGLEGNPASKCEAAYKSNAQALKACKVTGHALGKSDPAKIKNGNGGGGGGGGHTGPDVAKVDTNDICGADDSATKISIDIGCKGQGNGILDMLFAFIRFLSYGAGMIIVGSLVVGGIQYTASQGDPQATSAAVNRIRSTFIALLLYLFAYAILNYLIPGRVLQ